jgi:branched-chain amino acid transport system substrate-binding protein
VDRNEGRCPDAAGGDALKPSSSARAIRLVSIAAALVSAVAIAACGSSAPGSSATSSAGGSHAAKTSAVGASTSASTGTPAASTVSGAPIVVGTICSCSGPQASLLANEGKVAQAWADSVNASGGINGHPVKMIVMDDGENPATSLQDAKALVEQDKVMAIVGETSEVDAAWSAYVASKGIPVVGGVSETGPFLTTPDFFPSGTQLPVVTAGLAALAKQGAHKHLGVFYCAESPVCAQLDPITKAAAGLYGLGYTSGKISATAPSYAAPCLSARSAGVDVVYVADNGPVVQRVLAGCVQQGYKVPLVAPSAEATSSFLTDSNLDGTQLTGSNANPYDPSTPSIKAFQTAVDKYAPGVLNSPTFSYATLYPWVGGQLFAAAAKAADIGPTSTPAQVTKGLYALRGDTLGGLAPPLTFTPGKPAFLTCYFTSEVRGGKFKSLGGDKPTCLSAAQTAQFAAALKG